MGKIIFQRRLLQKARLFHLLAVLVAGLFHFVFALIWYSPAVFGKKWMKLAGVKNMKPTPLVMGIGLLSSLVMSFVLAMIVGFTGAMTVLAGAFVGLMAWVGFIATTTLGGVLWEGKSPHLYLLNNAFNLLALVVMGVIMVMMG